MKRIILSLALVVVTSTANSALIERLGGLAYYDDVADLTWLADANAGAGTVYNTFTPGSGLMDWSAANAWVVSLNVAGVTDWRLPVIYPADAACPLCTNDSEMGNLFYNVLGGSVGSSIVDVHNANYDFFSNIQPSSYWLAAPNEPESFHAWTFVFGSGMETTVATFAPLYAWAVHTGDVSAVPVPAAVWLFGSGLVGLMGFATRKKA